MAPLDPPADLTIPTIGSCTARKLLSRALGRLPGDLLALPTTLPSTELGRAELSSLLAQVRRLMQSGADPRGPAALLAALRSPTVAALLRSIRNELRKTVFQRASVEPTLIELVAVLAFELALAGVLDRPLRLTRLPPRLLSLSARAALILPQGLHTAELSAGGLSLDTREGPLALDLGALAAAGAAQSMLGPGIEVMRPYHALAGEMVFAVADNNPRAAYGAEPGEPGNPIDLGGHAPEAWVLALQQALAPIEAHTPDLYGELALYIRQMLPAGHHPVTHRSASYRESIGSIYLTLHPSPMTLTEALIHEFSHNKLHALFEIDPVVLNPSSARYRSPVRPDLRPLRGVLLAVHAFLPVAHLYEQMTLARHPLTRSPYFAERFAQIRRINQEGAAMVLAHAEPTPLGQGLLDEIRRSIAHFGP